MKKIVHKNQVVITTLALLLAIVGYISYDTKISNEKKDTVAELEKENNDYAMTDTTEEPLNPGETVLTSSIVDQADYASEVKLNREQIRSQNKEMLMEVINNESLTEEERQEAVATMVEMTDLAEKEAAAEMMLEAKGFADVVVNLTGDTADVMVPSDQLDDVQRAQIEDIIIRKTEIAGENIVITPMDESM